MKKILAIAKYIPLPELVLFTGGLVLLQTIAHSFQELTSLSFILWSFLLVAIINKFVLISLQNRLSLGEELISQLYDLAKKILAARELDPDFTILEHLKRKSTVH